MTLYLKDAAYIDWNSLDVRISNLAVKPGSRGGLSQVADIPGNRVLGPDDRIVECGGKFVTKSFACGHHHIYSTLARGMPAPTKAPGNFFEILKYVWWNLDKRLDLEMIEASALAAAIHCAKNGVTFIIDHHASPFAVKDSLDVIANAFDRVGVSHMLCYELSDRDGAQSREQGLAETASYLESGRPGHVGLHASFTVGDDLLRDAVDLARKHNTGLHLHVAEDKGDQELTVAQYGKPVVNRLRDAGALELGNTILSHCIHLTPEEKSLIAASKAWVAQNVESNQNNNVGLASYTEFADKVMLGTDGMHSDMLRSAKAAFLTGQSTENIGFDQIYQRFRNVHRYVQATGVGGDAENNLVILDYDSPTELNKDNFLGHFVFGIDARHVESVICKGKLIVENRRVVTVDENEVLTFAREMGRKLWGKMAAEI